MSEKYQALRYLCAGYPQWHVVKDNGIVIWFGYDNSSTPERDAKFWLESHQRDYPERFAGYEVKKEIVRTELQRQALALLADHDRLQAQVEQLRTEAKVASDRIQELGRFTKAQRGEIEGLRADAQRYNAFFDAGLPITFLGQPYYTKADLDEAIDSARAGREDGNGR